MLKLTFVTLLAVGMVLGRPTNDGRNALSLTNPSANAGEVTEGFQLSIKTQREAFSSRDPIDLELTLKNADKNTLVVKETAPWRDYRFEVVAESGRPVALTPDGELRLTNTQKGSNVRVKREDPRVIYRKVGPGSELKNALDLKEYYIMPSGNVYTIRARRSIYTRNGRGEVDIVSNVVRVRIAD